MARVIVTDNEADFAPVPEPAAPARIPGQWGPEDVTGLRLLGKGGKKLNALIQGALGRGAEKVGQAFPSEEWIDPAVRTAAAGVGAVAGAGSELALPDNAESAAGTLFGGIAGKAPVAERGLAISNAIPFKKPSLWNKLTGSMLSAKTAAPQKYAEAVAADPSIMGAGTVDKKTVGKMYDELYAKLGIKVNSESYKRLFGTAYPASEREVGKLKKMVEGAIGKLETNPGALSTEEAVFARQAARKLKESSGAKMDPRIASVANGHFGVLDDVLSQRGLESVKKLDQLYFRASAKEAFSHALPQNKNMSPNALRTNLMALTAGSSAKNLMDGEFGKAGVDALQAITMSPSGAASLFGVGRGPMGKKAVGGLAGLAAYSSKDEDK